ncbi:sensor histidine kinase [Streptomyces sp. NPDC059917]|uniref:sensor histidine kinase n=1 Tax=Streptomyces sp. NPDC059917 TaxID=3347002 RepID=UPI0036675A50
MPYRTPLTGAAGALCAVAAAGALAAAVAAGPGGGWLSSVTMATACVTALVAAARHNRNPRRLAVSATAVAVCSGIGTLLTFPGRAIPADSPAATLMSVEYLAVLGLVYVVTRFLPLRRAAGLWLALGTAGSTLVLRAQEYGSWLEAVGQCAFLSFGVLCAGSVGGYLRWLEDQRIDAVLTARRSQRLELARDLHDFVAHDVSAIVVLAQAAQVSGDERPHLVMALLEQIEAAGQQALKSLDRTVLMLRDAGERAADGSEEGDGRPASYGLADIPDVVARFTASGTADVALDFGFTAGTAALVPREVAGTAHRAVVEALTNIRRHAPAEAVVRVVVGAGPCGPLPGLVVMVTNTDGPRAPGAAPQVGDRRGGLGLVGLTERVEALGGSLAAGPYGSGGWRLRIELPVDAEQSAAGSGADR